MLPVAVRGRRAPIQSRERNMPIILWLLGVPLTVVILLWLFHII
jgi:hypothetical protein